MKETTYKVPKELNKDRWKEEHLQKLHHEYFAWCQLCMNKQAGERKKEEWNSDLNVNTNEDVSSKDIGPGQLK